MKKDVIILGAGAAGLMCAIEAGKRGRKVLLIDHAKSVGEKIRISGGGRCNFTNINASPAQYLSNNTHFCVSALKRYTANDFIKLVEKYSIPYYEKTLGQLFCHGRSQEIINMLLEECKLANVEILLKTSIDKVHKTSEIFRIYSDNKKFESECLVIATGGPSIPKMGATSFGYNIAKQFNIKVVDTRAALVPFILNDDEIKTMAGVATDVEVSCNKKSFKEAMLITHRGLSGPAILQISSYWNSGDKISINLVPDIDIIKYMQNNSDQESSKLISSLLPKRLAAYLCGKYKLKGKIAELPKKKILEIANILENWTLTPSRTEGYRTAEVTLGGVDTNELSSQTFESKKVKGLYFIGEVVDVTGHLGGYNFQWAWSSGYAAGTYC